MPENTTMTASVNLSEQNTRQQLVEYAQRAYHRGLVGGTGGNFSVRIGQNKMLVTASGVALCDTTLENLVTVDIESHHWEPVGGLLPSKEFIYHADILRLRPDVGSVLHVHSPYATAFAVKKRDVPMVTDAAFKQPPIPRVSFAPSGSDELMKLVIEAINENPNCKALLLEQHGTVSMGTDIVSAYNGADLLEELARIAHLAEQLKGST